MRTFRNILALSLLLPIQVAGQNLPIPALPFLEIPSSPVISAMGGAGVGFPTDDSHAFLYNPAQLGMSARNTRAAGTLYPGGSSDWLAISDLAVGSTALTAGVDLRPTGIPLLAGFGLGQTSIRFGERVLVDEFGEAMASYRPSDRYRAISMGVATAGAARLGVGATVRRVTSTDRASMEEERIAVSQVSGYTFDFGLLAELDITRLAHSPRIGRLAPTLSVAAGYAQSNIGGTVGYSGQHFRQALPRTARLGWSASAGMALALQKTDIQAVQAEMSVQAEHLLARHASEGGYTYAPLLGDLSVIENGLLGHGADDVTGRRGYRVELFETISFSRGSFDGWGFNDAETSGVALRLSGPLKLLGELTGSPQYAAFTERFDVRFTRSVYFEGEPNESVLSGISFVVRR